MLNIYPISVLRHQKTKHLQILQSSSLMGQKQFILNFTSTLLASAVGLGISFLLTPYIVNTLGATAYGFFPLSTNFVSYMTIVTIALNALSSRFITIELEKKNIDKANVYFNSVFFANIILSIALLIFCVGFLFFLDYLFDIPTALAADVHLLFAFTFISMLIGLIFSVFNVCTFAVNRQDIAALRTIVSNVLRVAVIFLLFYFFIPRLYYLGVSSIVSSIYLAIANFGLTKRLLPQVQLDIRLFDAKAVKEILSSGIWNSINQLSIVLLTQLDLFLVNIFLNAHAMGEFSLTKIVPNFIQMLVGVAVSVFVPTFVILFGKGQRKELLKEIFFSIKIVGTIVVIPISFFIVYGDAFFALWVPSEDTELLHQLSNLALIPMLVTGSINTLFNVYTVTNQLKTPAIVWIVVGTLNTLLVLIAFKTTHWGIFVTPVIGLITGLLRNLIFTPIYAARCLNLKWSTFYRSIWKAICGGIVIMLLCYGSKHYLHVFPRDWIDFFMLALCVGIVSTGIMLTILLNKTEKQAVVKLVLKRLG